MGKIDLDVAIVGGGAAGYFAAIHSKMTNATLEVCIFEQNKSVLNKVSISGGGRCNVTHACWDPQDLIGYYPRGHRELLGSFTRFACGDTMEWFESRGVALKIEEDGRVFPTSDDSATIVGLLEKERKRLQIALKTSQKISGLKLTSEGRFKLSSSDNEITATKLMIATGSSPFMWKVLGELGHTIIEPVPSLFSFHCKDVRFRDLSGLSLPKVEVKIAETGHAESGPLLITHQGISGPAVLKLSSWAARELAEREYKFNVLINWIPDFSLSDLHLFIDTNRLKKISTLPFGNIPSRLWKSLVDSHFKDEEVRWNQLSPKQADLFYRQLSESSFYISGKSTNKDEFVTAGGVDLKEVDLKTFQSRKIPNLYLAGEVLNIDALTGGFNFQAAWTGGYLSGLSLAKVSM